ncbi:MAG: AtuA-related protein, partial [Geminicoccaceae bacterium]
AIRDQLTTKRIKAAFPDLFLGPIERFEIDHLFGLNFVMDEALEGGVNLSLNLDSHGKSWSFLILNLSINIDD